MGDDWGLETWHLHKLKRVVQQSTKEAGRLGGSLVSKSRGLT